MNVSDFAWIAADPEGAGQGNDRRLVLVVDVAEDGKTVDVVAFLGGMEELRGLPVYDSRAELEEALRAHLGDIAGAQGIAHPLKQEDGTRRAPDITDVLPWHNGVYPLESVALAAGARTKRGAKDA